MNRFSWTARALLVSIGSSALCACNVSTAQPSVPDAATDAATAAVMLPATTPTSAGVAPPGNHSTPAYESGFSSCPSSANAAPCPPPPDEARGTADPAGQLGGWWTGCTIGSCPAGSNDCFACTCVTAGDAGVWSCDAGVSAANQPPQSFCVAVDAGDVPGAPSLECTIECWPPTPTPPDASPGWCCFASTAISGATTLNCMSAPTFDAGADAATGDDAAGGKGP